MVDQAHDFMVNLPFGWVDGILVVWLVVGFLRGRKHGMTQELLPVLQWIGIVLLGGFFNQPLASYIRQSTDGAIHGLWACVMAYGVIAFGTALVFALLKHWLGEKLTGSDVFGRFEYYLGILAGVTRYACMALVLLAIMHSRVVTQAELDGINVQMKKNLDDIHPPRYVYGCIEQAIFAQSFTGRTVQTNLPDILIPTFGPTQTTTNTDSLKKKLQDAIDVTMQSSK
jgi:uncharacterized membrane protein required for colicin V production